MAISPSAQMAKQSARLVDHYHAINKQLFQQFGLFWDHYSRTMSAEHHKLSQQFFTDLLADYIAERWCDQLYSPQEKQVLADRYLIGQCPQYSYEAARVDECSKISATYEANELINPRSRLFNAPLESLISRFRLLLKNVFCLI